MKRGMIAALCLMALLLGACAASDEMPATEPETVQTEAATVPTEPAPTEPEAVETLAVCEYYGYRTKENGVWYSFAIDINPNSGHYETRDTKRGYMSGTCFAEGEDRILIDIDGEPCTFRKNADSLVLESGHPAAYSLEGDSVEVPVGAVLNLEQRMEIRAGIYVLDTSEYDFSFDEVLMNIDLTEMTFVLRCFDGNVVTGTLDFDGLNLVCSHPGGRMIFYVNSFDGLSLNSTTHSMTAGGSLVSDQLMFCPQTDSSMSYRFVYAEDREEEIVADPQVVPLDSYKYLYQETFSFQEYVPGKEDPAQYNPCSLFIRHYPLEGTWEFQTYQKPHVKSTEVAAEEHPDGSITFSQDGKEWTFHRGGDALIFDGGSPLIVGNWHDVQGREYLEMEVPAGTDFYNHGNHYLYDALYILPGATLEEASAGIQIDVKNQLVKIHCYDGTVLEGPYTYEGYYLNFACEIPDYVGMRSTNIMLIPHGHSLGAGNQWMLNIGPGGLGNYDYFDFFPVQGVDYSDATASEPEPVE